MKIGLADRLTNKVPLSSQKELQLPWDTEIDATGFIRITTMYLLSQYYKNMPTISPNWSSASLFHSACLHCSDSNCRQDLFLSKLVLITLKLRKYKPSYKSNLCNRWHALKHWTRVMYPIRSATLLLVQGSAIVVSFLGGTMLCDNLLNWLPISGLWNVEHLESLPLPESRESFLRYHWSTSGRIMYLFTVPYPK